MSARFCTFRGLVFTLLSYFGAICRACKRGKVSPFKSYSQNSKEFFGGGWNIQSRSF